MAIVVLEVVSLLWSHPILAGLLILLFTTPLFHIVLFFTPLLMSTALCVIALISIGPQIEKIREERQFKMSLSARSVAAAAERPVNRFIVIRQGRPQRPPMRLRGGGGGGGRWSDWVKGIEIQGHTVWLSESHIMKDIAEEGLKSDFCGEDGGGGIAMTSEDFSFGKKQGAFVPLEEQQQIQIHQQQQGMIHSGSTEDYDDPIGEQSLVRVKEEGKEEEQPCLIMNAAADSTGLESDEQCESSLNEAAACRINRGVVVSGVEEDNVGRRTSRASEEEEEEEVEESTIRQSLEGRRRDVSWLDDGDRCLLGLVSRDERFVLASSSSKKVKKRRAASWFRRRRIPCLSKALGQLKEKICSQLRRIFS